MDIFRDDTRDKTCEFLQSIGIVAKMAERGRPEENIGSRPYYKSLGIIDITGGPIHWINVIRNEIPRPFVHLLRCGVPDTTLDPNSPKIQITSEPKHKFLIWGRLIDLKWNGEDSGVGIISRLNGDSVLKEATINSRVNITINAHPSQGL